MVGGGFFGVCLGDKGILMKIVISNGKEVGVKE